MVNEHATLCMESQQSRAQDPVVALDLEWRPDRTAAGRNRVALMQLATSTVCVLVRTNRMKQLPLALEELLR